MSHPRRICLLLLLGSVVILADAGSSLAVPTINQLSLRGLQTGATTTLAIERRRSDRGFAVLLPFRSQRQEMKPSAAANRLEFEITLDAQISPGIYPLRVTSGHGISNAVLVGVDHLAERPFAAETGTPAGRPQWIARRRCDSCTRAFDGSAGQRVVIDVEGHRLGSKLNPVVHLLDARNAQIAWGQMNPAIAGDARIVATLPADGRYTVELHDAFYRGAEPGTFRLKIGDIHYADGVFPMGASAAPRGCSN